MACNLDLYRRPKLLGGAKTLVNNIETQIKMVERFYYVKTRLENTDSLDGNAFTKCAVFVRYFNESAGDSNFCIEALKLSLDELAFCFISFTDRRLKLVLSSFKALYV